MVKLVEDGPRLQVKWDTEDEESAALRRLNAELKDISQVYWSGFWATLARTRRVTSLIPTREQTPMAKQPPSEI